jgi:demethylmenaquinone methyltransferase / 2-methoxy-6-polyprenyl-1,4-benzoquinol methylase
MTLPYKNVHKSKKEQVADMFDNISGNYDFLNHFLSGGIDVLWRKKAIKYLKKEHPKLILDVATGTADFAIEALKANPEKIIGIDISEGMLKVGKEKLRKMNLEGKIELQRGDSENLPFEDEVFDAVTVAFGVRNFENLEKGLKNMYRVLKKGGIMIVLEFSRPNKFPVSALYGFYFKYILPVIGKLVSRDNSAYTYLPESVSNFPQGNEFINILNNTGFASTRWIKLTWGISSLYICRK